MREREREREKERERERERERVLFLYTGICYVDAKYYFVIFIKVISSLQLKFFF